jgi:hypothetical protein
LSARVAPLGNTTEVASEISDEKVIETFAAAMQFVDPG